MTNNSFLIFASTLLVVAGCTVEAPFEDEPQMAQENGTEITIRASLPMDPETKTMLNTSNGAVLWMPGDAISLFYGSGANGGSRFASNTTEPCNVTNFTGTITAITGGANISLEDTFFWGVYPYRDDTSCDGASITMTLPSQQTATPGTFASGLFPSMGRSQGLTMGFYNICGGWRFSVTKEGLRKVTLKSNGGEIISGKVKVGLNESGIPVIQEIIDGSDEVVLECPKGEYFEVGKNYYMIMLPTTMASGFTMTFETYTEEGSYNRSASTKITRSNFIGITNIDNYLTSPYAQKTGNIPIEDANFKAYLVDNFDSDSDGEISYVEAATINEIQLFYNNTISSLSGLEYCTSLSILTCFGMNLTSLDVSNNTELEYLNCTYNQLTYINLSNNTSLEDLTCTGNQLSSLDVSSNTALSSLSCSGNQLTSLDVSNSTSLIGLSCEYNQLTSLDLSNNNNLLALDCSYNQLTSLDLSNLFWLQHLECYYNQITNLDISLNTDLKELECGNNQLTSLDVSNNHLLTYISCHDNHINNLDVTNNYALTILECNNNHINNLDISNNTSLTGLSCADNPLSSLDLSTNTALEGLSCGNNELTSLDVSHNTALLHLWCGNNQLVTLDVSNNPTLSYLICSPMSTLETLKIAQGQELFNITSDRSEYHIPASTQIVVAPSSGGNEGTGDNEVNP